jgi:hypothetical protein
MEVHKWTVKRLALDRRRVERRTEARPPALPSTVFREPPHATPPVLSSTHRTSNTSNEHLI